MSKTLYCIITSSTYYADGAHFEFELADHQHALELTKAVSTNGGLKCRLVIGGADKHTPAIIDRWSDGPLTYCLPEDVARLEALNAELLDTLKKVGQRHFCGCGAEGCRQCTEDCMVLDLIEKAGGAAF